MRNIIDDIPEHLNTLNDKQLEAVLQTEGPSLVLAGAGTGKTKVLTSKIAHILLSKKAFASQILAVTFTNKAAKEMRHRIEQSIDGGTEQLWLGTFHSIAAKILRRHAQKLGLRPDFIIIDSDDQLRLIKQLMDDKGISIKSAPPKLIAYWISRYKDKAMANGLRNADAADLRNVDFEQFYIDYNKRLINLNAADFGDLILHNITLLREYEEVQLEYRQRFRYILVDEYQDTNVAQYLWLRLLTNSDSNICCVGDDDQSIYGWRGAEVTNILRFDKDFKNAKIVRLEQNYRSTQNILAAATKLIANNRDRHGKTLWTQLSQGNLIKINSFYDDKEEARFISEEIENLQISKKHLLKNIAVLVRAGHQTRVLEEFMNLLKIPYRIVGGLKFYERAEIKDSIAYIRVLASSLDSLAFERIINLPRRGIGNVSIQAMRLFARDNNLSLMQAAEKLLNAGEIKGKAGVNLASLFDGFVYWRSLLETTSHRAVIAKMLEESGYIQMWEDEATDEAKERLENIKELLNNLDEFSSITEYLEHVSLVTDIEGTLDDNLVTIMTMHASKGLEFETVFLAGWEEGVFPSQKSIDEANGSGLEEERRLAYVGITRAKSNLYISYANKRRLFGTIQASIPSRFLGELPESCYEIVNNYGTYYSSLSNNLRLAKKYEVSDSHSASIKNHSSIIEGNRVFHIKFGYGKVLNISSMFAEVAFDKAGTKKVLTDYLELH